MSDRPYERFRNGNLILRDELAVDRTVLANERTVLAYLRGAVTLVIAGVTFIDVFHEGLMPYLGFVLIPLGIAVGIFGYLRFRRMNRLIHLVRDRGHCDKHPEGSASPPDRDI